DAGADPGDADAGADPGDADAEGTPGEPGDSDTGGETPGEPGDAGSDTGSDGGSDTGSDAGSDTGSDADGPVDPIDPVVQPHGTVKAAPGSALVPGGRMQIEFTGLQAGEQVRFVLHSTPMPLDETLTVAADGTLTGILGIPEDAEIGTHELEAIGASGVSVTSESFTISKASAAGTLPTTGVDVTIGVVIGAALLAAGALLLVGIRRRRTR
ncbi:MAG TPA: LPXTG cell wall anchor domain-containing protein, partial [Microbacterium sp.]|nr:LPXTG cell wall anchor domain-containing protein [Microbacterium sp.]